MLKVPNWGSSPTVKSWGIRRLIVRPPVVEFEVSEQRVLYLAQPLAEQRLPTG